MEGKRLNIPIYFWLCTCLKMCRFLKRKIETFSGDIFQNCNSVKILHPKFKKRLPKNESENESIFLSPFWLLTKNNRKKIKHPYIFLAAYLNSYTEMWLCLAKKINFYKKSWSVFTSFGDLFFFSKNQWICG